MKALVVEDDFGSRKLAQKLMESYGHTDVAVNGEEAYRAYIEAHAENAPYDLILLDIMMPGKDGQEVLKDIRSWENAHGINGFDGVKILMMTALNDSTNIMRAFREQCEGYIVKPVTREKIVQQLKALDLMQ